jgi:hypothetical protein
MLLRNRAERDRQAEACPTNAAYPTVLDVELPARASLDSRGQIRGDTAKLSQLIDLMRSGRADERARPVTEIKSAVN